MPREVKIQYRKDRKCFFTRFNVNGKRTYFNLGRDPEEAKRRFCKIMVCYRGALPYVPPPPGPLKTVRDVCAAYLDARKGEISDPQWRAVKWMLDALCAHNGRDGRLGDLYVSAVTSSHLVEFLKTQELRGWSPETLRHATVNAKAAMRWAAAEGAIERNPWQTVKAKTPPRKERRVLSKSEIAEIVDAAPTPKTRAMLTLLYETAARPSELMRARWENVNFGTGQIVLLKHKTDTYGNPRIIYLSAKAIQALKELGPQAEGYIFPGRKGKQLDRSAIRTALARTLRRLSRRKQKLYEGVTPYTFRHSRATHLIQAGVDPATVARVLGNKPSVLLDRYAWPTPAHVAKALDA